MEGSRLPEVEDAFRILYEDYPPIRLAGNLLFDMIGRAVESCPTLEWGDESAAPTEQAIHVFLYSLKTKSECRADEAGSSYLN